LRCPVYDTRTGETAAGQELFCGRRTRNKNLNSENLHKYRGHKVKNGRVNMRRQRYPLQVRDFVYSKAAIHPPPTLRLEVGGSSGKKLTKGVILYLNIDFEQYNGLIIHLAKRQGIYYSIELEDLLQEGHMILWKAAQKYNGNGEFVQYYRNAP